MRATRVLVPALCGAFLPFLLAFDGGGGNGWICLSGIPGCYAAYNCSVATGETCTSGTSAGWKKGTPIPYGNCIQRPNQNCVTTSVPCYREDYYLPGIGGCSGSPCGTAFNNAMGC